MAFKPLGGMLPQQLKRAGIERGVVAARVLITANEYIDEKWGKGTSESSARAIAFKFGKLQIASLDAGFRQEIAYHSSDICQHINDQLGRELIKKVQAVY